MSEGTDFSTLIKEDDKEIGKLLKEAYILERWKKADFFEKLSAIPGVCRMFDNWQRVEGYVIGLKDCGRGVTIVSFEYGNRTRNGGSQNVCILSLVDPISFRVAAETKFAHIVAHIVAREVHES